jgi:hypothetical protein
MVKLDLLTVSGKVALRALINYQYDVDVDFTKVDIVKTVEVLNPGLPSETKLDKVEITTNDPTVYVGKTRFKYRTVSMAEAGLDTMRFVLPISTLPVTVGKVADTMLLKYGINIETEDLGPTDATVLATAYGLQTIPSADTSLRFNGDWLFNFVDPAVGDLSGLLPEMNGGQMGDIGYT